MKANKLTQTLFNQINHYGLVLYFIIPYILFLKFFQVHFQFDYRDFFWGFKNSIIQSGLTASFVTLLSVPLSLGLFRLSSKQLGVVRKLLLIPQILPALFSILIAFSIFKPFPMGTIGIVLVFSLVHLGYSVLKINLAIQEKLGSSCLIADVFGIGSIDFYKQIYFPLLKTDLLTNFVLIFTFCFSSFSIPLVAGGGLGTNLEVLIYEKIFIAQDWSTAWVYSGIQSLFIFFLSWFFLRKKEQAASSFVLTNRLISTWSLLFVLLYLALYLGGYLWGITHALSSLHQLAEFYSDLWQASWVSLKGLMLFLMFCFVLLFLLIFDLVGYRRHSFVSHLISPSTILVSFVFYLLFPQTAGFDTIKMVLAMSILFFPSLYKSFIERPLTQLQDQLLIAEVFGLSKMQMVVDVVLRQIKKPILLWMSFLIVWFLSDFAVQRALGNQSQTVGLLAEGFLSSYRLSLAYLISFYILVFWFVVVAVLYFILEVFHVIYKKFIFKIR